VKKDQRSESVLCRPSLEQLAALQRWIDELASEIAEIFKRNESCQRLATIPGIGPLVATALFSGVGDPLQFKNGRQFAAWLGLTPKQRSSGGKSKLGGITKHGDTYLRTLLGDHVGVQAVRTSHLGNRAIRIISLSNYRFPELLRVIPRTAAAAHVPLISI